MSDLTAFPMDSQVTGMGDDGLPVYDRAFDSTDLREVYKTYFSNGYFAEVGTSMHVKAASGMTATVETGKVNIQGTLGFMTEDATVTFAAAGDAARVDTVVARLDLSVEKRVIELDVLKGEEGVTTAPSLTRDSTVWELGLADVTIPANSTAIKDENVKDTRLDTTRCGVVNPFAKLDTDSLFAQVTAIINKADADTTANIERLNSEVDATIADTQSKTAAAVAKAETDVDAAISAADAALAEDTAKLDKATADAVSAMNDALSSTVLGSVWRLGSSSSADYLAYGDDLNNIASVCTKFCESASVAGGIANKPADVTGAFVVYTFATEQDPSRLGQMLLAVDTTGVSQFFRSGAGSSWTEWATVGGADQTARDAAAAAQAAADKAQATANSGGWIKLAHGPANVSALTVDASADVINSCFEFMVALKISRSSGAQRQICFLGGRADETKGSDTLFAAQTSLGVSELDEASGKWTIATLILGIKVAISENAVEIKLDAPYEDGFLTLANICDEYNPTQSPHHTTSNYNTSYYDKITTATVYGRPLPA